jgi:hypothetical protein
MTIEEPLIRLCQSSPFWYLSTPTLGGHDIAGFSTNPVNFRTHKSCIVRKSQCDRLLLQLISFQRDSSQRSEAFVVSSDSLLSSVFLHDYSSLVTSRSMDPQRNINQLRRYWEDKSSTTVNMTTRSPKSGKSAGSQHGHFHDDNHDDEATPERTYHSQQASVSSAAGSCNRSASSAYGEESISPHRGGNFSNLLAVRRLDNMVGSSLADNSDSGSVSASMGLPLPRELHPSRLVSMSLAESYSQELRSSPYQPRVLEPTPNSYLIHPPHPRYEHEYRVVQDELNGRRILLPEYRNQSSSNVFRHDSSSFLMQATSLQHHPDHSTPTTHTANPFFPSPRDIRHVAYQSVQTTNVSSVLQASACFCC